jgi:hypothetical protein
MPVWIGPNFVLLLVKSRCRKKVLGVTNGEGRESHDKKTTSQMIRVSSTFGLD